MKPKPVSTAPFALKRPLCRAVSLIACLALLLTLLPSFSLAATNDGLPPSRQPTENFCPPSNTGAHAFGNWDITSMPTCTRTGTRVRICRYCQYQQTQTIPKEGHSYGAWITTKSATCTREGTRTRTCSVCGHTDTETLKKKAHSWGEWTVIQEATPFSAGTRSHKCKNCGTEKTDSFDPEGTLRRGDKGSAVKGLQNALNAQGFDCGKADGDFGKKTQAAVSAFEASRGLAADGVAWPGVQAMLGIGTPDEGALIAPVTPPLSPDITPAPVDPAYGWTPPEPSKAPAVLMVEKTVESEPANHSYYTEGETVVFLITVSNPGGTSLFDVHISDLVEGSSEQVVDVLPMLEVEGSAAVTFSYQVTAEDVKNGFVRNVAMVTAQDEDGNTLSTVSNEVAVEAGGVPSDLLSVEKMVYNTPENGAFFVEGETVVFLITVTNAGETDLFSVTVEDLLDTSDEGYLTTLPILAAGDSADVLFSYTVTPLDMETGYIVNTAVATALDTRGNFLSAVSNEAVVPTGIIAPLIEKEEVSEPENGSYYVLGEQILYVLFIRNPWHQTFAGVTLYDLLYDENEPLSAWETLSPGEEVSIAFGYTVTEEDVAAGLVINNAYVECERGVPRRDALPVISPVGKPPAPRPDARQDDTCVRTLTGLGQDERTYTQDFCASHHAVKARADALSLAAQTDAEKLNAWRQIASLWTVEVNALYNRRMSGASKAEIDIITRERTQFFAYLTDLERLLETEHPSDPVSAAQKVAEALRKRCTDLCYEVNTAPTRRRDALENPVPSLPVSLGALPEDCERSVLETRKGLAYTEFLDQDHASAEALEQSLAKDASADAWEAAVRLWLAELDRLTNLRYLAADEEGRKAIAAERIAFGELLRTREGFLSLVYPGRPAIVQEVLAETIRTRVLDLCGGD